MKQEKFEELLESVRQGGEILRGKTKPSRSFKVKIPEVQNLRQNLKLSQEAFAAMIGISASTLKNWEQKRRTPHGPARILLRIVTIYPEIFLEMLNSPQGSRYLKKPYKM